MGFVPDRSQLLSFCSYLDTSQLTEKTDVYGFGIVLLELICARPPFVFDLPEDQRRIDKWVCAEKPAFFRQFVVNVFLHIINLFFQLSMHNSIDSRKIDPKIGWIFLNNFGISKIFSKDDFLFRSWFERYVDLVVKTVMKVQCTHLA